MSTISNTGKTVSLCLTGSHTEHFTAGLHYGFKLKTYSDRPGFFYLIVKKVSCAERGYIFSRKRDGLYITWGSAHFPTMPMFKRCKIELLSNLDGIVRISFEPEIISRVEKFISDEFLALKDKAAQAASPSHGRAVDKHPPILMDHQPRTYVSESTITIRHEGKTVTHTVTPEQVARTLMNV